MDFSRSAFQRTMTVLLVIVLSLSLLSSCGDHKKEKPPIPLEGLSKTEHKISDADDGYLVTIEGRSYRFYDEYPSRYLSLGKPKAYELIEGWRHYYYSDLFGTSDCIARFRPDKDGNYEKDDSVIGVYTATDVSQLPGELAALSTYPKYEKDYVNVINHNAKYIRVEGSYEGKTFPYAILIEDRESLDRYIEENRDALALDAKLNGESFLDAAEEYDKSWFTSHQLLIAVLEEGSGSISHKVINVYKDPAPNCFVVIDRNVPEVGTADMAHWQILIELDTPGPAVKLTDDYDIQVRMFNVQSR